MSGFNPNTNAFIDPTRGESYPSTPLADYSLITDFITYNKLTFWNKLEFIGHSSDKKLLTEIYENVDSRQLKALALYRLTQLDTDTS